MIFFTSDHHLFHTNILRLCNRPFETIEKMNEAIICNHNSVVTDNDTTYNLGDLFYKTNPTNVARTLEKFNGKIKILPGNHDKVCQQALNNGYLKDLISSGKVEIIGDFYPSQTIKVLELEGKILVISHYPLDSWCHSFRNSYMIHGHCHGKLSTKNIKRIDVGVDCNNFYPITFGEIIIKMELVTQQFSENI